MDPNAMMMIVAVAATLTMLAFLVAACEQD
jgi:hypothetical protein